MAHFNQLTKQSSRKKAMPPRRRQQTTALPNGIQPDALPAYVYWDRTGNGRWIWRPYQPHHQRRTSIRLGGASLSLRQIWDAYEAVSAQPHAANMRKLVSAFEQSPDWQDLAPSTQRDYRNCAEHILCQRTTAGQIVADTRPCDWTPGAVRAYVDRRGETSRSRANHELRYLRRLFGWAYERDQLTSNPARGVRALKQTPRQRYVSEGEYAAFLETAGLRYPYLLPVCELAYLCRLRLSEVLDLRREDIRDDGLFARRRKGSKDALTGWTPRLRAAVEAAKAMHGPIASLYLIPSPSRGRLGESTVQTAWQRAMRDWAAAGNPRFTIHDLKRAGVSDAKGDKLAASGHRSAAMLRVYDVLPAKAPATR
jgi:integrase